MRAKLCIAIIILLHGYSYAQDFENNDLEGPISGLSTTPPQWSAVPQNDPSCNANFPPGATADLTNTTLPSAPIGLMGNPYSGNSFVSAIAADSYGFIYMEGIMQTVSGFMVDSIYEIHFYQAVVKQFNMKDNTGSWVVYADNVELGVSELSSSSSPYNSISFNWYKRSIVFTATAPYHVFKFFPKDNDDNGVIDEYDASGALRMGIDSIFITPWCNLNADLGNDTLLCAGDSLLLSVTSSNADYLWQDGSTEDHFLVTEAGIYSVSVSNMCGELNDQVEIEFDNSVYDLELGGDLELCEGDTFNLLLEQDNVSYLWQDNSTDPSIDISQSGMYWTEIFSEQCSNSDSLMAYFYPLPILDFPTDTILCEGSSLFIQSNLIDVSFLWQDNSTNYYYQINNEGNYWLQVTDNGCSTLKELHVEYINKPTVRLPHDTLMCLGQRLKLNVKHEYSEVIWQDFSSAPDFMVSEPGTYFAEVVNECGYDSATVHVDYDDCKCFVYIPNTFTPNGDGRNDRFNIEYDCFFENYELLIFDRWGQMIFKSNDENTFWDGTINGNEAQLGVYGFQLKYESFRIDPITRNGTITLLR